MRKYHFNLLQSNITGFLEKDHIIPATSLEDAVRKFTRKHELEAPAYWDEPFFDKNIELILKQIIDKDHSSLFNIIKNS